MPAPKKIARVAQLTERLVASAIVVGTGVTSMNAAAMVELRRALREKGVEYQVVKNTLAAIAGREAGRPQVAELLRGATGLVLSTGDPIEAVKTLEEYRRTSRSPLTVYGALLDGRVLTPAEVETLASLPPRPQLIASLAGQLLGLIQGLVTLLNTPPQQVVSVLNAPLQDLATVLHRHAEGAESAG